MCMLTLFTIVSCWLALVLRFHHNFTFPLSQTAQCLIHRSCFFSCNVCNYFHVRCTQGQQKHPNSKHRFSVNAKYTAELFWTCICVWPRVLNVALHSHDDFHTIHINSCFIFTDFCSVLSIWSFLEMSARVSQFLIQIFDHIHANNLCDLKSYHSK